MVFVGLSVPALAQVPDNGFQVGAGYANVGLSTYNGHWLPNGTPQADDSWSGSATGLNLLLRGHILPPGDASSLFDGNTGVDYGVGFAWYGSPTTTASNNLLNMDPVVPEGNWGLEGRLGFPWRVLSLPYLSLGAGIGALMSSGGMPGNANFIDLLAVVRGAVDVFGVPLRLEWDHGLFGPFDTHFGEYQLRGMVGPFAGFTGVVTYSFGERHSFTGEPGVSAQFKSDSSSSLLTIGLAWTPGEGAKKK